jgi:hypothetical protein
MLNPWCETTFLSVLQRTLVLPAFAIHVCSLSVLVVVVLLEGHPGLMLAIWHL